MQPEFKWSRLEDFTASELYAILQARVSVFVVEQQCPYQEADGRDLRAWHLTVRLDGELAAYCRVIAPGDIYPQPSIGRVLVRKPFRAMQMGRALMREAIRFTESRFPAAGIKIQAQAYLETFYGSLGFQACSEPYDDEDGIPHIDMVKPAA